MLARRGPGRDGVLICDALGVWQRIMIIDGAMGTVIQQYKLEEEDFLQHQMILLYPTMPQTRLSLQMH